MTPQEMLIGIDLILQKVNTNVISSYGPEEKLWFLNEEIIRFIRQRMDPKSNDKGVGIQENQKRYDDFQELITPASLTVYPYSIDDRVVYGFLPANYFTLLNDQSFTKDLCGASYNPTTSNDVFYSVCYKLPNIDLVPFNTLKIIKTVASVPVTIFNILDYYPSGIPDDTSKFEIINLILEIINGLDGFEAKYEYYKGVTCIGGIVVTSSIPFTLTNQYQVLEVVIPETPAELVTHNDVISDVINTLTKISNITGGKFHPNRLSKTEDIPTLMDLNFGTTFYNSPISELQRDLICVWHNKKFILSKINIIYIRKPKKISLSLNQGCELNENVHQEIVENTARRLAGLSNSDEYRNIINENLLKE